jgi:hypothetical protein
MSLLLSLVLAQAAAADVPVAIVVSSRRDAAAASALCVQLKAALGPLAMSEKESVDRLTQLGGVDPQACDGAKLCLQKLAQLLRGVVIGVDVSKAGKLLAGHIEAVSFDRVESLATDDLTGDMKSWPQKTAAAAQAFGQKLQPQLLALKPKEEPKAAPPQPELKSTPALEPPREATLVPEPPPQPPEQEPLAVTQAPGHNGGPVPYIVGGAAALSLIGAVVLMVLGFADRSTYQSSFIAVPNQMIVASSLRDDQLNALASASNLKIGSGGALIGVAAALGVVAGILFARE